MAARIQFSILAVEGYIRLTTSLEHELDRFIDKLHISVPVADALVQVALHELAAEAIARVADLVVRVFERRDG